jgi:uncharacterized alpha-E superfamily protein
VRSHDVAEFLLKDPHFPRTVKHCLAEIEGCLSTLPQHLDAMKQVRKAWRRLDGMKLEGLTSPVLHEYLDQVQADIGAIHAAVARQYFHLHQRHNGSGEDQ